LGAFFTRLANCIGRSNKAAGEHSKYVDLAPTDKADDAGVYSGALLYATDNPRVLNIALTGPYGSGKSSIIKSFLKKYRRPALHISLAAFLTEEEPSAKKISRQEIERSILQQMLYGSDANKLPLSRFKRIQAPGKLTFFISLFISIGLFSIWHLLNNYNDIIKGYYFLPFDYSNWLNLTLFVFGISFIWFIVHRLYIASFGVSLKSISLKDIEISTASIDQESILNRHLDEIIYFFQSTSYDLVIIEDLDRFEKPDIFITLREINSLINQNAGVKRTIRFLYALRDDMFMNTDRTKFFEFITPVIPIINSSNSIDKVLEQGRRLSLDDRLDRQFLREVSRYLNDLRLIQNIFNEYAIYVANLETDGENVLDANKLLAVLIYKNVYPKDFEDLHRGIGTLAKILSFHDNFITQAEAKYKFDIAAIEEKIDISEKQFISGVNELRQIYVMSLIEKLPSPSTHVYMNGSIIPLRELSKNSSFEDIFDIENIRYRLINGQENYINISDLQSGVDPRKTYQQRKDEIEYKSSESKSAALKIIYELRLNIESLRTKKFNELLRLNLKEFSSIFNEIGDNGELARFLIIEGYLDDTYYQYTSLFHSGRLSPNDNKFLIQIRGFLNPEPDFQIDNPNEVIAAMRLTDFGQSYVLNVKIVDCLLGNAASYTIQTTSLFEYIASNFDECGTFFKIYYATGAEVSRLISGLAEEWDGFFPAALASVEKVSHIAQIIAHLPEGSLDNIPGKVPEMSDFISSNLDGILALGVDFEPTRLELLQVVIDGLASIEEYPGIARFLFESGLYEITIPNLEFIFRAILGKANSEALLTQHYTTVLNTENSDLIRRVERDFDLYLQNILLRLENNSQESITSILSVINRDEINLDDLRAFIEMQTLLVPSLNEVSTRLYALLFQLAKIEPSWENCLIFMTSETFDSEILSAYLNRDDTLAVLSRSTVPDGVDALVLRKFLIEADVLQNDAYRAYVLALPKHFKEFPNNLGADKLRILIEERKITLSKSSLAALEEYFDLAVLFVANNIETYLNSSDSFELDDEFREELLGSGIRDEHRLAIVQSMDLASLGNQPTRAAIVGPILDRTGADLSALNAEAARAVIVNSRPISVQISLFNKCQSMLSDGNVRDILAMLPEPFSEIRTGYSKPRIKRTDKNIELVSWLDARNFISSWSETAFSNEIRINLYRR